MSSVVEGYVRKENDVAEVSGDLEDSTTKEIELYKKVVPIPRPPPPFPQRLVNETEDGKYW